MNLTIFKYHFHRNTKCMFINMLVSLYNNINVLYLNPYFKHMCMYVLCVYMYIHTFICIKNVAVCIYV